jgi:cyanophycin synthetase
MKKITITGTKGKTTTTYVVSQVLQRLGNNVLRVDTAGHYVNGAQRSTLDDAKQIWGLVPTVAPGRYLWEFLADPALKKNGVAVMEAALGSSGLAGLGYRRHEVGVFLNVMEDHIGSSTRLQSRADIVKAKSFVFGRIKQDGYAVFNADDALVVAALKELPPARDIRLVACGLEFKHLDLKKHLRQGGVVVTTRQNEVVLIKGNQEQVLFDIKALPWTFNGTFEPSVYNLLHAAGAIYAYYEGRLPAKFRAVMEACRLDPEGGRLTILKAANGARILVDYAHEKNSLVSIGELARTLIGPKGKVIGLVRLAYDRTPELIRDTGRHIAGHFDAFVVYDKVDGHFVKTEIIKGRRFQKEAGKVSELLAAAIAEKNPNVQRIVREDKAIEAAATQAGPEDIVVVIANDDVKQSLRFVKQASKAEYV